MSSPQTADLTFDFVNGLGLGKARLIFYCMRLEVDAHGICQIKW